MRLRKSHAAGAALLVVALIVVVAIGRSHAHSPTLTIEPTTTGRPIPSGFVGLSVEYATLESYAGTAAQGLNPVFAQLARNLAPGQQRSLRIGGDTTDWTWWPIPGLGRPPGIRFTLTSHWLATVRELARTLDAHLILGINFEADSRPIAAAEARALTGAVGPGRLDGLELGNEPELYDSFAWFMQHGHRHYGRPPGYDFAAYDREYSEFAAALPSVPLAGPSAGGPRWMRHLNQFLADQPRVKLATLHRYPLKRCTPSMHPTVGQLLSDSASRGLADYLARYVDIANAHGVPLRIDEINAVSCGGAIGVSNTFASALWAVDAMFQLARVGVDGVNIHSRPGSSGELFSFRQVRRRWQATINPEYYGLMLFARAAPPGARLLQISGRPAGAIRVWATRAPSGRVRVVLINKSPRGLRIVTLRIEAGTGVGSLQRLTAPSATAGTGMTLAGQSFPPGTTTGALTGTPRVQQIVRSGGDYVVPMPPASAALLTLSAG